jgi:hypothetical protein
MQMYQYHYVFANPWGGEATFTKPMTTDRGALFLARALVPDVRYRLLRIMKCERRQTPEGEVLVVLSENILTREQSDSLNTGCPHTEADCAARQADSTEGAEGGGHAQS